MTEQKAETKIDNKIALDGTYYNKFIDGLKADATKTGYINSIKRYIELPKNNKRKRLDGYYRSYSNRRSNSRIYHVATKC